MSGRGGRRIVIWERIAFIQELVQELLILSSSRVGPSTVEGLLAEILLLMVGCHWVDKIRCTQIVDDIKSRCNLNNIPTKIVKIICEDGHVT